MCKTNKTCICSAQQQYVPHYIDTLPEELRRRWWSWWCLPGTTVTQSAKITIALISLIEGIQAARFGSRPVPGSSLRFGGDAVGQHCCSVCALRQTVLKRRGNLWVNMAWGPPRLNMINLAFSRALKHLLNTPKKPATSLPPIWAPSEQGHPHPQSQALARHINVWTNIH